MCDSDRTGAGNLECGLVTFTLKCACIFFGCVESYLRHMESSLQHAGSSSLTRDRTQALCIGSMEP